MGNYIQELKQQRDRAAQELSSLMRGERRFMNGHDRTAHVVRRTAKIVRDLDAQIASHEPRDP